MFPSGYSGWNKILHAVLAVIFLADIGMQFIMTVKTGHITLEQRKEVRKHYLAKWFYLDLIAALPFDIIGVLWFFDGATPLIGALMLLRLVKLLSVPRLFRDLQEAANLLPSVMRLVMFSFWLAASLHVMAESWVSIGGSESSRRNDEQYLRSLYWVVTTVSTIGYGDYHPDHESNIQIAFTIVLQFVGVGMFSYIIANVSNLLSNLDIARSAHQRKLEEINAYMRSQRIPAELQERVLDYYAYLWTCQRGINTAHVLDAVPDGLSQEILLFLNKDLLSRVSLFSGADELFVRESVRLMKPVVFLPGEYVIRQGEFADCMYFLATGKMRIEVNELTVAHIEGGSPFGETALVENQFRNATVISETYGTGYRMSKDDFNVLRAKYPEFDRQVEVIVATRKN